MNLRSTGRILVLAKSSPLTRPETNCPYLLQTQFIHISSDLLDGNKRRCRSPWYIQTRVSQCRINWVFMIYFHLIVFIVIPNDISLPLTSVGWSDNAALHIYYLVFSSVMFYDEHESVEITIKANVKTHVSVNRCVCRRVCFYSEFSLSEL